MKGYARRAASTVLDAQRRLPVNHYATLAVTANLRPLSSILWGFLFISHRQHTEAHLLAMSSSNPAGPYAAGNPSTSKRVPPVASGLYPAESVKVSDQ